MEGIRHTGERAHPAFSTKPTVPTAPTTTTTTTTPTTMGSPTTPVAGVERQRRIPQGERERGEWGKGTVL